MASADHSLLPTGAKAASLSMSGQSEQQNEYTPALTEELLSSLLKVTSSSVRAAPEDDPPEDGPNPDYRSGVDPHSSGPKQGEWITNIPDIQISASRERPTRPIPAVALAHYPRILPDRFSLNKSKGYFFGIWPPVRMEHPDFIPEDRRDRIGGLITHLTKLSKPLGLQGDGEEFDDTFDTIRNLQSPSESHSVVEDTSLSQLAVSLLNKFRQTGFRRDLEEALRVGNLALLSVGITGNERQMVLLALGTSLSQRFRFTTNLNDLHDAIKFLDEATGLSSGPNASRYLECLVSRAVTLTTYFCQTKTDMALNEAIVATSDTMQELLQSPFHNDWFLALSTCSAILYGERFCKDPCLLDWIVVLESSIHIIADEGSSETSKTLQDDSYKRQTLEKLSLQLSRFHVVIERLDRYSMPADCDAGVVSYFDETAGRVLAGLWEEYGKRIRKMHPVIALAEIVNSAIIQLRYMIHGDLPPSNKFPGGNDIFCFGISSFQFRFRLMNTRLQFPEKEYSEEQTLKTLELNMKSGRPSSSSSTPDRLRKLSMAYRKKYDKSNDLDDLTIAIRYSEAALNGTVADSTEYLTILEELLELCYLKSVITPNDIILGQVINYSKLALGNRDLREGGQFSIASILADTARQSFVSRFSSLQEFDDVIDLVEKKLLKGISANHDRLLFSADLPYTLAMCLKTRYQNTGEPKNLDDSIKMIELAMTFPDDKRKPEGERAMLVNFGLILRLRYQRTKSLGDLDRAIEVTKEGLQRISKPAERLGPLNNLVLIFNDRHDRTQGQDDLRQAISYGKEGLAITKSVGNGGSVEVPFLVNLANALSLTGDPLDLDTAVNYGLEAVGFDPNRKGYQAGAIRNDLSEILLKRYGQRGNFEDLDLAVKYADEAQERTPSTHPLRGEFLLQLGACLSRQPRSEAQVQRCLYVYQDAWNCLPTLPAKRIEAATYAAKLLLEVGRIGDAAQLLESAVELMPELEVRWTQRTDRQNTAASCLALPANAAMIALQAGNDAVHALSLLETGRGRMLGSLMDFRSDVAVSHEGLNSAEVVRTFNRLRMKADATTSESESRQLKEKMKSMIQDIRRKPGFENFMFPPTPSDYMKLAVNAPIVVVTTSELVDPGVALIVTASRIYSLPLVNLTHQEMTTRMHEMSEHTTWGRRKIMASRNSRMLALLEWLWDTIVEPILNDLGFKGTADDSETPLPRNIWVGVGLLAKAPFHAAGKYLPNRTADDETAANRVISSYAPSLRALLYSTGRKQNQYLTRRRDANVLLVQMSTTEGATPLANVEEEVRTLTRIASSASMQTATLNAPTTSEVLKNLPLYNLVHFACHGLSDPEDPSESHLILSDGRLTVQEIMRTHAAAPDVAFLSACSTAKGNDARLVDESIHIASAFLMIGFRQVVGTLWETPDRACMEISNRFYAKLVEEDEIQWNGSWKVAEALHYAVKEVRDLQPKLPLSWASFVAFGA